MLRLKHPAIQTYSNAQKMHKRQQTILLPVGTENLGVWSRTDSRENKMPNKSSIEQQQTAES